MRTATFAGGDDGGGIHGGDSVHRFVIGQRFIIEGITSTGLKG
jgi:hypothetical protein